MIRKAVATDATAVAAIAAAAYAPLAERMDTPPAPMLDDYAARVAEGVVDVADQDGVVAGYIILVSRADWLMLENVAVAPDAQGQGIGRQLMAFADTQARARGFARIRLYTHTTMVENQAMYLHLGFREIARGLDDGYDRVQFEKTL